MKFVTQERYKDALCGRFAKIRGDIDESLVPQFVGIGTKEWMMNKTQIRKTNRIVNGVRIIFIKNFGKISKFVFSCIQFESIFAIILPRFACNMGKMKP